MLCRVVVVGLVDIDGAGFYFCELMQRQAPSEEGACRFRHHGRRSISSGVGPFLRNVVQNVGHTKKTSAGSCRFYSILLETLPLLFCHDKSKCNLSQLILPSLRSREGPNTCVLVGILENSMQSILHRLVAPLASDRECCRSPILIRIPSKKALPNRPDRSILRRYNMCTADNHLCEGTSIRPGVLPKAQQTHLFSRF